MAVKDFMTRKVVYISPDTTVAHAADLMREQGLHRLPVIENDQLVGLVTEGTIAEASPSKATSLSIYEMNYLLNKTKVKDVMIRDVITVSGYASLEDATYLMLKNKIGILPVVDNQQVYGVITDRDVFQAFLEIAGYGEEGIRVRFITENEVGVLFGDEIVFGLCALQKAFPPQTTRSDGDFRLVQVVSGTTRVVFHA